MSVPHSASAATSEPKDGSMAESSLPAWHAPARALVRRRWWVLGCWGALVAFAATRAARTADRLDLRGGSLRPNEASRVDALLAARFRHDAGETFVVIVSGPAPREPLDALCAALQREPYVRDAETVADDSSGDPGTAIALVTLRGAPGDRDRKSTRLNSSHSQISYAVFCLKKKNMTAA